MELSEEEKAAMSAGMHSRYLDLDLVTAEERHKYVELDDGELLEMYRDYKDFLIEMRKVRNLFVEKRKKLGYEMWAVRSDLYSYSLPILLRIYREYLLALDEITKRETTEGKQIRAAEDLNQSS